MSALVYLPYGEILDACYESLRIGDSEPLRYAITLAAAHGAFTFGARGTRGKRAADSDPGPVQLPAFKTHPPLDDPTVVAVVPVFVRTEEEETMLTRVLASLGKQTSPPDHIIVVDDASPRAFEVSGARTVRLSENGGPATARNAGKESALELGADIVAFTDMDCIVHEHWVSEILAGFAVDPSAAALSGRTLSYGSGWLEQYHDLAGTLNGKRFKDHPCLLYGATANLAVRSDMLRAVDFDESFPEPAAEDVDFCFRALLGGFATKHAPDMIVRHDYAYRGSRISAWRRLLGQFRRYGRGHRILVQSHPDFRSYETLTEPIRNREVPF